MRAAALLVVLSLCATACEPETDPDPGAIDGGLLPPAGAAACAFGAQAGDPCSMAADAVCYAALTLRQCLNDVKRCRCVGGRLTCDPLSRESACMTGLLAEGYACVADGAPYCARAVPGGNCTCAARRWSCSSVCPEGCPPDVPSAGAACTLAAATICPYDFDSACSCTAGRWSCD